MLQAQIFDDGYQEPIARVTYTEEVLPDGTEIETKETEQIINRARRQEVEKKNVRKVDLSEALESDDREGYALASNVQVKKVY